MSRLSQFFGYFLCSASLSMILTLATRAGYLPLWLFVLLVVILLIVTLTLQTTYGRREFARLAQTAPGVATIIGGISMAGLLVGLIGGMF